MSDHAELSASRLGERRRQEDRSLKRRRRSEDRSRSRSRRRRQDTRSRSRSVSRRHGRRREADQREKERAEKVPSETVLVHGIPDAGVTEERLEAVAWEIAVRAGCSMPNGVHFAYDRASQKFRGFAIVEFPHKEASKMFVEHSSGLLEVDGYNLALRYHHSSADMSRSRSRERGRGTDEPSVTLIIKGIASTTSEATLASTFQPFATIKDIRHFPRRGFAFVQFHTVEDAVLALKRFEHDCKGKLDGYRVVCHFAKEREDGRYSGAERSFF